MPQEELQREPLPHFVRLKTTPEMTKVAANLVIAKKAIAEIGKIEARLLAGDVSQEEFKLAMQETANFAKIVQKKAAETASMMAKVKAQVQKYKGSLKNAVD